MADKGIYTIITAAAMLLRFDATYGPRLINCWLPAETWVEALKKSGHIDATLNIDTRKFNAAFARSASFGSVMSRFDGSNTTGVFHVRYRHQQFYYFTEEIKQILYPSPLNRAWKERVLEVASIVLTIPSTRARSHTSGSIDDSTPQPAVIRAENAGVINEDEQEVSPNKRQRVDGNDAGPSPCSYWPESPEAYLLFKPRREFVSVFDSAQNTTTTTMEYIETPQEALERRILQLKAVHESENSWRCVVQGGDPDNYCTKTEIYEIRQRSVFLVLAYQLALQHMNKWTWHECCQDACKTLNGLGLNQATFYKTVAQWNMGFRKLECFPHPNLYVQCGKRPLPRLLEIYPDAKEQILSFGMLKNLAKLTIESVRDFIVSTVIPRLALQWQQDEEAGAASADQQGTGIDSTSTITTTRTSHTENQTASRTLINSFLHAYGLKTLSFSTAWRWMKQLGFEFDDRKKSFYVDGHEREDVVANRKQFCTTYLTKLEPYCKRWIQIPINDAIGMANVDVEMGHRYFDIVKNTEHIEYHVDYWNRFGGGTDVINPTTSIRVSSNARPIMIIGQDESVFSQYLMGAKTWIAPNGQRPLLPKSEGDGYMLSAFVSRDFGFGRQMSDIELERVNNERRATGSTYKDTHAAMEINGTVYKAALTESPFVKYLYIGVNNEGYWNSYHMSLQFEDIVDCLKVLYPSYDIVFTFDHSQGHARKREHALSAQHMSKSFGGAQARMRDTLIMAQDGFLGPHLPSLTVGDTQSLIFKDSDTGPWYLNDDQREIQRRDRPTGRIRTVERSKKQLLEALKEKGVTLQQQRGFTKKELQVFATNNNIELSDRKEIVAPGWVGQPKGLLQVLSERGLIERGSLEKYTLDGRKDNITGTIDLQYSLRNIMAECTDFKDEESALQYLGSQLGVTVLLTPKFHAELAGEGVEYSWAHAKAYYRRMPLSRKRGKENFKQLVRDCTCPVTVLTKERIEKFASRARAYVCTYHHLQQEQEEKQHQQAAARWVENEDQNSLAQRTTPFIPKHEQLLYAEIERLMKAFKCHRCALDFDRGFVHSELRNAKIKGD